MSNEIKCGALLSMGSTLRRFNAVLILFADHFAARSADLVRHACAVAGGMCTNNGIIDWCTWTGRGLVKKSARLSVP